jgi:hypothetical protein
MVVDPDEPQANPIENNHAYISIAKCKVYIQTVMVYLENTSEYLNYILSEWEYIYIFTKNEVEWIDNYSLHKRD